MPEMYSSDVAFPHENNQFPSPKLDIFDSECDIYIYLLPEWYIKPMKEIKKKNKYKE